MSRIRMTGGEWRGRKDNIMQDGEMGTVFNYACYRKTAKESIELERCHPSLWRLGYTNRLLSKRWC